jgi:peroxiredoxin (alkyl hydroperoxide reductase subunit C)
MVSLLTIGDQFPAYAVTAVIGGELRTVDAENPYDHFTIARNDDHPGLWRVIFFWPRDVDPASQAEIVAFGRLAEESAARQARVLGVSVDNKYVHFYWRANHDDLKTLPFPLLSDYNHVLSAAAGVLNVDGVANRAAFIVDPSNEIRYVSVSSGSMDRNVDGVLRVLDDLQSDDPSACGPGRRRRPHDRYRQVAQRSRQRSGIG